MVVFGVFCVLVVRVSADLERLVHRKLQKTSNLNPPPVRITFQPSIFKPDWRHPPHYYRTLPLSSSKLGAFCAFALFGTCRDKPVPKSAVVVQMQAKGDMDSETFWPSFCCLFCIYFSKFLAPLLHLIFDAKMSLFASLWGAFWCLFGAMGSSGTPLAPWMPKPRHV